MISNLRCNGDSRHELRACPRYLIGRALRHHVCTDIFSFRSVRNCGRCTSTFWPRDRNFTVRRESSSPGQREAVVTIEKKREGKRVFWMQKKDFVPYCESPVIRQLSRRRRRPRRFRPLFRDESNLNAAYSATAKPQSTLKFVAR